MKTCEVTRKRGQKIEGKRPDLLSRKIEIPELKSSLRLKLSAEGAKVIKDAGGVTKFLQDQEEAKLSPKLAKLRAQLIEKGVIKVKGEKPAEEAAPEAAPAEATATEEAPAAEASTEEASPEAPAAEAAPAEEK
jgi:ribosomal protein L28